MDQEITLKLSKNDVLYYLKDELLDSMLESCYEWLFEEDNAVQRLFTNRLTEKIEKTLLQDKEAKQQLMNKIAENFAESLDEEFYQEMANRIVEDHLVDKLQAILCNPKLLTKIIKEALS